MRCLALLVGVAGCPFHPGTALEQQGGDGGGRVDGKGSDGGSGVVDAAIPDAFVPLGPPAHDTATSIATSNTSTVSWTHDAEGSHRLAVVGVSWGLNAATISSITYGGVPMSQVVTRNNTTKNVQIALWKLVAPPTGTQTIVVTFSSSVGGNIMAGAVGFTGVDQTTPTGTPMSSTGGGNSIATTVTSGTNEVVIDTVVSDGNPSSLSAGSSQTTLWTGHQNIWIGASVKAGAASVMMTWSEGGSSDDWAQGAVSIRGG